MRSTMRAIAAAAMLPWSKRRAPRGAGCGPALSRRRPSGGSRMQRDRAMAAAAKIAGLAMMLATITDPLLAQERVTFPSADGKTTLTGYVFMPAKSAAPKSAAPEPAERMPAVVMMHGRGGAYSTAAKGRYDSSTISRRHRMWGELWA